MTEARQQGQIDAWNRWRDKVAANPMTGATELPYIKPSRYFHRHKESFSRPNVKIENGNAICECGKPMLLLKTKSGERNEFYCDDCRISVPLYET
jgi:hypothetical protein